MRYQWLRLIVAVLLICVILSSDTHAVLSGPVLVANPNTASKEFKFAWERSTIYAQGNYWSFWQNTGTCEGQSRCLYYASSPDGTHWNTPVNVGVHVNREDYSITTDGNNVFYARYNETDFFVGTCNDALLFREGALSTLGTVNWQPEQTVIAGNATTAFISPNLKLDSNGQAYIGFLYSSSGGCGGTGNEEPRLIVSSGTNYALWGSQQRLSSAHSANWGVDLTSLGNGAMYITYFLDGSTATAHDLHGRLYNSTLKADQQISAAGDKLDGNSFVFNNGPVVFALWLDEVNQRLNYANTTFTGPSTEIWNSPIKIATSECCASSSFYSTAPWTATYDSGTNLVYIFWYNYTNNAIDLYTGLGSSWSGPNQAWSTSQSQGASDSTLTSFQTSFTLPFSAGQTIGVQFFDGIAANMVSALSLKYATDVVQGTPQQQPGNPKPPSSSSVGGNPAIFCTAEFNSCVPVVSLTFPNIDWRPFLLIGLVTPFFVVAVFHRPKDAFEGLPPYVDSDRSTLKLRRMKKALKISKARKWKKPKNR